MPDSARIRWFVLGTLFGAIAFAGYSRWRHTPTALAAESSTREATARHDATRSAGAFANEATSAGASDASTARPNAVGVEIVRLRALLIANGISPDTGARVPPSANGAARADGGGADDASVAERLARDHWTTDLTPDEWRELARQGRLRLRLPGVRDAHTLVNQRRADGLHLSPADVEACNDVFRRAREHLNDDLRALYRESVGSDPGTLSLDSLRTEIQDKTAEDVVHDVNYELAQERGGVAPAQSARPDMSPYERMMREMVGYEREVQQALSAIVGPTAAHDLLWGEYQVDTSSMGF